MYRRTALQNIKLHDKIFAHTHTMSNGNLDLTPQNFRWYRGNQHCNISVFTDFSLDEVDGCTSKYKVALLMESPEVFPQAYHNIKDINKKFDIVLTFDKSLLDRGENYKQYFLGGSWIKPDDCQIYPKSKFCSMIASDKNSSSGHNMRHKIASNLDMDVYGSIRNNPIDYKLDGLKDYVFSVVIENTNKPYYFTEKLIDCLVTGTIPIIWCSEDNLWWYRKMIKHALYFNDLNQFCEHIDFFSTRVRRVWLNDWHKDRRVDNYNTGMKYYMPEDNLWNDYFKEMK